MEKSRDALRTISEVADRLGVPTHVLRFWESRFSQVRPIKRAGGRRYYRPSDIALLDGIRQLLHDDGLTIRGVQKILREQGISSVTAMAPPFDHPTGDMPGEDCGATRIGAEPEEMTSVSGTMAEAGACGEPARANAYHDSGTAHDPERQMDRDDDPATRSQTAGQDRRMDVRPQDRPEPAESRSAAPVTSENGEVRPQAVAGSGDRQAGKVEVNDLSALLRIYDRLLALRERMSPVSKRSDEGRTHRADN